MLISARSLKLARHWAEDWDVQQCEKPRVDRATISPHHSRSKRASHF